MKTGVAIIIPVHNNLKFTQQCISGLYGLLDPDNTRLNIDYQIVIVDDGSQDGTEQWLRQNFPEITVLKGDGTLWWSGGITKGARHAIQKMGTDYLLLWNNDIVPHKDYFNRLSQIIREKPRNMIIGSKICDLTDPSKIWSMGGIFNPRKGHKYMLGLDVPVQINGNSPVEPDWLTGMGTLLPSEVIEKIGYWNAKDFPQYYGDADFTYRAKLAGFKLVIYPELTLYNDTSVTGFMHQDSFGKLLNSFVGIRSKYNIKKEIKFYRMYAESWRAYIPLFIRYFRYIGGFFKWKILRLLGVQRQQTSIGS